MAIDGSSNWVTGHSASFDEYNKLRINWHTAQEFDVELLCHYFTTTRAEHVGAFGAVRAHETAHVLDHPNYVYASLHTKVQFLLHICCCHSLRCCNHHSTLHLSS